MIRYEKIYEKFIENNAYPRKLKSLDPTQGSFSIYRDRDGKKLLNFSSSDYLGLARHPLLIQRSQEYAAQYGVGSGSSRLVTGNLAIYETLEKKIAEALQKPAALILGAGYQTNISVLEALLDSQVLGAEPLLFSDRLCHISMITSSRHLGRLHRFRHNDMNHLHNLLKKFENSARPKFILVESVYSMDGDCADLPRLIDLANQYQAFLYVDDAHAVGVYGATGWGRAPQYSADIPVIMGTFSKGLGSYGAYIGCSETLRNYLINKCKGLIYSTGSSPAVLGAIAGMLDLLPNLSEKREQIVNYAERLRCFFRENALDYGQSNSQIVPWIIGDAEQTICAANYLEAEGILGTAIQPPSVPVGKSRIRFCITANHTEADIQYLMEAIRKVAGKL
jgi:8-amino-7-oxononanoate synthase